MLICDFSKVLRTKTQLKTDKHQVRLDKKAWKAIRKKYLETGLIRAKSLQP